MSREFKNYRVRIFVNGYDVARGTVAASAPCKAVELFCEDNNHVLRPGHAAKAFVSTENGLCFSFELLGTEKAV